MEEIICPHCGVAQKIDPNQKTAFCSFCGSSLTEVLKDLQEDQKAQLIDKMATNIPKPQSNHKKSHNSSHLPFSDNQQIPSLPRVSHKSKFTDQIRSTGPPSFQATIDETTFPSKQKNARLEFPQLEKNIVIPSNLQIYHFGRNILIPLVSPKKFDVEWLNSISRVRKQSNNSIRQHFKIFRTNDGKYFIEDQLSRWGTWVNREQIKNRGKFPLKDGDRIELMLSKPNIKQIFPFVIIFRLT